MKYKQQPFKKQKNLKTHLPVNFQKVLSKKPKRFLSQQNKLKKHITNGTQSKKAFTHLNSHQT